MHTYREPDTWRGAIRGITHMLVVPQGIPRSRGDMAVRYGGRSGILWCQPRQRRLLGNLEPACLDHRPGLGQPSSGRGGPRGLLRLVVDREQGRLVPNGRRGGQRVLHNRTSGILGPAALQTRFTRPWGDGRCPSAAHRREVSGARLRRARLSWASSPNAGPDARRHAVQLPAAAIAWPPFAPKPTTRNFLYDITRAGHEPVVIIALADYESLKETAYLLRSPENARRLLASIDRLEHGAGIERDLL